MERVFFCVFLFVLFCGCVGSPTGDVVGLADLVCDDGSVVEDLSLCPSTSTSTSTTSTSTTSTSTSTSSSVPSCGPCDFGVGSFVETVSEYNGSYFDGVVFGVEEVGCNDFLVRVKTSGGSKVGVSGVWLRFKTTTTTSRPVLVDGSFDARFSEVEVGVSLKASFVGFKRSISGSGDLGTREVLRPIEEDKQMAVVGVYLSNYGRETFNVGFLRLEAEDGSLFYRTCVGPDFRVSGYFVDCSSKDFVWVLGSL